jgi:hypothetical protein
MGKIIHLDREGSGNGGSGIGFSFIANDWNNLNTVAPQPVASGTLAYCFNSQGTKWLPGTIGGNYYPQGIYVSDGAEWISDRNAIAEQLQINVDDIDQLEADLAQEIINRTNADSNLQTQINAKLDSVVGGTDISIDNTDPNNPVINFSGTSGEANTSSNLGTGEGLAQPKVGVDLPFKSLVAGDGISLTSDANEVTINSNAKEHRHIYFAATNTTDTVINNVNIPVKVAGTTTQGFGTNGLVMSGVNRIVNQSNRTLRVKVEAVLSLDKEEGGGNDNYTFFINQTGANLIGSKSTSEGRNNDWNTANPTWIGDMANGQWFEVWVQNIDSANDLKVSDYSLIVQEI